MLYLAHLGPTILTGSTTQETIGWKFKCLPVVNSCNQRPESGRRCPFQRRFVRPPVPSRLTAFLLFRSYKEMIFLMTLASFSG